MEDLGLCDYQVAWEHQTQVHESLIGMKRGLVGAVDVRQTLILCQHPHVYTLGKSGKEGHLKIADDELREINAEFYKINRGGDITYHGPGQLVAYPILDLDNFRNDVHWYVRSLEEVILRILDHYGVAGGRIPEFTGVWVRTESANPSKICAIGVHLSRWVSLHGLAFNVDPDLHYFSHIIPCGIQKEGLGVTSLSKELGREVDFEEVKALFIQNFEEIFNVITKNKYEIANEKNQ